MNPDAIGVLLAIATLIIIIVFKVSEFSASSQDSDTSNSTHYIDEIEKIRISNMDRIDQRLHEESAMLFAAAIITAEMADVLTKSKYHATSPLEYEQVVSVRVREILTGYGYPPDEYKTKKAIYIISLFRSNLLIRLVANKSNMLEVPMRCVQICNHCMMHFRNEIETYGPPSVCTFLADGNTNIDMSISQEIAKASGDFHRGSCHLLQKMQKRSMTQNQKMIADLFLFGGVLNAGLNTDLCIGEVNAIAISILIEDSDYDLLAAMSRMISVCYLAKSEFGGSMMDEGSKAISAFYKNGDKYAISSMLSCTKAAEEHFRNIGSVRRGKEMVALMEYYRDKA